MTTVDLRSDTVTKPTPGMLEAMWSAKVGDDVFGEDETINILEQKAAAIFGMEAGLFCPSGTMTNQIAIKCFTQPLDELIADHRPGGEEDLREDNPGIETGAGETEGRTEDSLIAYTWDKFLRTGDAKWPARLPMTKAAVRAMDTVTAFCGSAEGGNVKVDWINGAVQRHAINVGFAVQATDLLVVPVRASTCRLTFGMSRLDCGTVWVSLAVSSVTLPCCRMTGWVRTS